MAAAERNSLKTKVLAATCILLVTTIVWQIHKTSSILRNLSEQVRARDNDLRKMQQTYDASLESVKGLRDAVEKEAQRLVRVEEEELRQALLKEADDRLSKLRGTETTLRADVLAIVSSRVSSLLQLHVSAGDAAALVQLGADVRQFAKKFLHSNIPPNVREWFVFFKSEVLALSTHAAGSESLVEALKQRFWIDPPVQDKPYQLSKPHREDGTDGQALRLMQIFNNKESGVFIECGAFDGEEASSSLYLERRLGWRGVLMEPAPDHFSRLLERGRRSVLIPACVSPQARPLLTQLLQTPTGGRLVMGDVPADAQLPIDNLVDAFCFPLHTVYRALGVEHVDLLILNAHGLELEVLQTVPWEEVDIRTIVVSVKHLKRKGRAMRNFLEVRGFEEFGERGEDEYWAKKNLIFTRMAHSPNQTIFLLE